LGEALVRRAEACLDARVIALMRAKAGRRGTSTGSEASWLHYAAGHSARARALFQIAAEVAARRRTQSQTTP
jgi:hypothetical protein